MNDQIRSIAKGEFIVDESIETVEEFSRQIELAVEQSNAKAMGKLFYSDVFLISSATPEMVNVIVRVLGTESYRKMTKGHSLILQYMLNWHEMDRVQHNQLRRAMVDAFPHCEDWMTRFTIIEILGEYDEPDKGLAAMMRLLDRADQLSKRLLPHGIGQAVERLGKSAEAANEGIKTLRKLARDDNPVVSAEAEKALWLIQNPTGKKRNKRR